MMRFGDLEYDLEYIRSGFTDSDEQTKEAASALRIVNPSKPQRIVDIGCGIGTHDMYWARQGHRVTAIDISPNFIQHAIETAASEGVSVEFLVGQLNDLNYSAEIDLVVCIEFFPHEKESIRKISRMLTEDGLFMFDVRNPFHPDAIKRGSNWKTWKKEDETYYLERHETDEGRDLRTDEWITIDTANDVIKERFIESRASESKLRMYENANTILRPEFGIIEFLTLDGTKFTGGPDPYWLWCIARK